VEEPFRLTSSPAEETSPAWSPDGGYIAFARALSAERFALVVIPQRGGPERVVSESFSPPLLVRMNAPSGPAWTPDGKSLVASGRESQQEPFGLFVISVATGEKRRLTSPPASSGDFSPAVSPDGRTLIFSRRDSETRADLYLQRLAPDWRTEGEPVQLPAAGAFNLNPAWTADGREIVFHTGVYGGGRIPWMVAPSKSATPRRIALPGSSAASPTISPRGDRLAYTASSFDTNIWRVDLSGSTGNPASRPSSSPPRGGSWSRTTRLTARRSPSCPIGRDHRKSGSATATDLTRRN
jgi:Tol biopolymer transport system component